MTIPPDDGLTDQGKLPGIIGLWIMVIPAIGLIYGIALRCRYPAGSKGHAYGLAAAIVGFAVTLIAAALVGLALLGGFLTRNWPVPG